MQSVSKAAAGLLNDKLNHLHRVAALLALFLGIGMAIAKFLAVSHAFQNESLGQRLLILFKSMPFEMMLVAALLALALLARRLPKLTYGASLALLAAMYAGFALVLALTFINLELFRQMGSPVKYHLMLLAPTVGTDLLRSGIADKAPLLLLGFALLATAFFAGAVLCPRLASTGEAAWRRQLPWFCAVAIGVCGVAIYAQPARGFRETLLREMHVASMLLPSGNDSATTQLAPPSAAEIRILEQLRGGPDTAGETAFAPLARRKRNIILWVWESVGERYLKSHHALGEASTPNLDRLLDQGGVRFSHCYAECPLTIQTAWTLMTGMTPPARANIFTSSEELPPFQTTIPKIFKDAGYRTAKFNSGKTDIWNVKRVLGLPGFDVNEDSDNLANRARFNANNWGIEDAALLDRVASFLDETSRSEPFFVMIWNVDTHHPYMWPGMPDSIKQAKEKTRYLAAIEHSDAMLGQLHAILTQRKLVDDTLVVIVGDHGEGHGRSPDRPFERAHSMLVFEDSIHVPLIFLHPALKAKRDPIPTVCGITDVMPTLLELAGIETKIAMDGAPLSRSFEPKPVYSKSILWWPMCSRLGKYKLLLESPEAKPQLYDIAADPFETNDLAEREVELTNALMCDIIRMADQRYKTDASFKYRFISAQKDSGKTPDVKEMLQPQKK